MAYNVWFSRVKFAHTSRYITFRSAGTSRGQSEGKNTSICALPSPASVAFAVQLNSLTRIKLRRKLRPTYFSFRERVRCDQDLNISGHSCDRAKGWAARTLPRRLSRRRSLTKCPTGNGVPTGLRDFHLRAVGGCFPYPWTCALADDTFVIEGLRPPCSFVSINTERDFPAIDIRPLAFATWNKTFGPAGRLFLEVDFPSGGLKVPIPSVFPHTCELNTSPIGNPSSLHAVERKMILGRCVRKVYYACVEQDYVIIQFQGIDNLYG